jgi:hypothetical protein
MGSGIDSHDLDLPGSFIDPFAERRKLHGCNDDGAGFEATAFSRMLICGGQEMFAFIGCISI